MKRKHFYLGDAGSSTETLTTSTKVFRELLQCLQAHAGIILQKGHTLVFLHLSQEMFTNRECVSILDLLITIS
jgi:hypothetical protein